MNTYIKDARKKLGLTQEQFATRIMVSVNTIRAWEQGKRNPGKHALAYIAEVLSKAGVWDIQKPGQMKEDIERADAFLKQKGIEWPKNNLAKKIIEDINRGLEDE